MIEDFLHILKCPATKEKLSLRIISKRKKEFSGKEIEIIWEGILLGGDQWFYPIINGVPRLIVDAFIDYKEFLKKHVSDYDFRKTFLLKKNIQLLKNVRKASSSNKMSFTKEWELYAYEKDKTWNMDAKQMLQQFLDETNESLESLHGKLIFDAGCGNGHLNILLAKAGIPTIAMDISLSVVRAFDQNTEPAVFFLQGDVFFPPVEYSKFDIVHSSGVLIATHDPELAFSSIEACVKQNGKLSVWLYHPRNDIIHNLFNFMRRITSKLPIRFQYYLYTFTALPLTFIFKKIKGNKQNSREMMVEILDWFSPKYRWEFNPEEVCSWYRKHHYSTIMITTKNIFGFNIIGIKNNNIPRHELA